MCAEIPPNLPLSEPDLGSLLSNLLENAYRASNGVQRKPYIAVFAQTENGNLLLELRNSVAVQTEFRDGMPQSKTGGGTGTRSVAQIVRTHRGMLTFSQEGAEFIARIIVPLADEIKGGAPY